MSLKNLSLRWRMILIVPGIPMLFLMPIFVFVGLQYRGAYQDAYWKQGEIAVLQVEQIIVEVGGYIETLDDTYGLDQLIEGMVLGESSLQTLPGEPEVPGMRDKENPFVFIALVDKEGLVIVHSSSGFKGQTIPELTNLDTEKPLRRTMPIGEVYLISRAMQMPGAAAGELLYIVVAERATIVDPQMFGLVAVLALVASTLIILLNFAMDRLIFHPLHQLAEGAAIVGGGKLTHKIDLPGADEFAMVAAAFNEMARRLYDLVTSLEKNVAERTADLERKTVQLEAVSVVGKEASQAHNVPALLDTTVNAISDKFGFYHTGIFILDDEKEWSILRAASSEGGKRMLAHGHRLRVGQVGIVGNVSSSGKPRIVFNVGEDSVWFNNPDLPDTRSEMALPLKTEEGVIGVLDVQSEKARAFTDEDINTLQLMADQVTIALYNARLLEGMQATLAEVQELQIDYSRRGWARVASRMRPMAYEYDRVDVTPVSPLPVPQDLQSGRVSRKVVMDGGVPVVMESMRSNDRVIGYMGVSDPQRIWAQEELALLESVSAQVALALENARLFEDTQRNERQQFLISRVLQVAADPNITSDQVLTEIARVLAQGLDMAVVIFTFPVPNLPVVHPHAVLGPEGQTLPFFEKDLTLSDEHHIFFRGLSRPELGPMSPLLGLEKLDPQTKELLSVYDFNRVLYVPISSAGVQSGFIAIIQRIGDSPLDPDTRELAQGLASQIAVVIDNLNLSEETRQRSEEMQALYQISLTLSEILEPQEALAAIVEQGVALFGADAGSFFLFDIEEQNLVLSLDFYGDMEELIGSRLKSGEGVTGTALLNQQAVVVDDYETWDGVHSELWDKRFRSAIAVPLIGRFGPLGVLVMRSKKRASFDTNDARLSELFAAQAGTALENAQLNREAQRRASELSQLYDAGIDLLTILDVQLLLDRATRWACKVFKSPTAVIFFKHPESGVYVRGRSVDTEERVDVYRTSDPSAGGLTEMIINTGESVLYRDNSEHPSENMDKLIAEGLLSQIGVPLRMVDDVVGAFFVNGSEVNQFGEQDLSLLEFLATQVAAALQNALQFNKTESALSVVARQARYQSNVSQAVALLTEQGTAATPEVLRLLGEAAEVGGAIYFRLQEEDAKLYWVMDKIWVRSGSNSLPEDSPFSQPLLVADYPFWVAQLQQRTAMSFKVADLPPAEQGLLSPAGFQAMLVLAVQADEVLPGFIALGKPSDTLWANEEILALQTAAAALSNTIARERLFHQVERTLAETEALYQGSAELNLANTYEANLDVLRRYTILGRESVGVFLQLFDRPWTDKQKPEYTYTVAAWPELDITQRSHRFAIDTLTSQPSVMNVDAPILIRDVATSDLLDERMRYWFSDQLKGESAVFVPLIVGGQRIGYVLSVHTQPITLLEQDSRRLEGLVRQAAIGVQNLRQLQAIQARARREQMIREITGKIQAAPDVQGVLQTAVREMGRAFGTTKNRIQFQGIAALDDSSPDKPLEVPATSVDAEPTE